MNNDILKLAKEVGGKISITAGNQDRLHSFSDDGLEAFYRAAFNAGNEDTAIEKQINTPKIFRIIIHEPGAYELVIVRHQIEIIRRVR